MSGYIFFIELNIRGAWVIYGRFGVRQYYGYTNHSKTVAETVKDTAKEIFEKLLGYIGSQQQFCIVDEEHKTLIDCDKLFDFVGNLAKEKGVQVE